MSTVNQEFIKDENSAGGENSENVNSGLSAKQALTHEELLKKMREYLMSDLYLELSDRYISLDETEPKAYGYARDEIFIEGESYPAGSLVSYNFLNSEVRLEKAPEEIISDRKSYYLR